VSSPNPSVSQMYLDVHELHYSGKQCSIYKQKNLCLYIHRLEDMKTLELWRDFYEKINRCKKLQYHMITSKTEVERQFLKDELLKELQDIDAKSEGDIWDQFKFGYLSILKYSIFYDTEELPKAYNVAWNIHNQHNGDVKGFPDLLAKLMLQIYREIRNVGTE
jgi:hypothetical protein